jgi:hypothetical protein
MCKIGGQDPDPDRHCNKSDPDQNDADPQHSATLTVVKTICQNT